MALGRHRSTTLWRQPNFLKLWFGQTISEFGSMLGALSLLAILDLGAKPAQMGLLETLRAAPVLLIGLLAGVWVDRLRRRPILIMADLGRVLLLTLVGLAALWERLQMIHLYLVAFLIGGLTIFFNVAYRSFLPALVSRPDLVEANGKLSATASLAEIGAPGLGGLLVQLISAPFTVLLDAASFLVSALSIASIRAVEPAPVSAEPTETVWRDITTGLRRLVRIPTLRALAGSSGMRNFFGGFFGSLYALFVLRELELTPALLGLIVGAGGIGSFIGALVVTPVTHRFGAGRTLIGSIVASGAFALLIPLAGRDHLTAVGLLVTAQIFGDLARTIYVINELSVRQTITPDHLLGRVNASFDFLVDGIGTLGLFAGGALGQFIGLRPAIAIASGGIFLASLWLVFSPVRALGAAPMPENTDEFD